MSNSKISGGYKRSDGPAPSQASITTSLGLQPIPNNPILGPNKSYPRGVQGNAAAASAVFRDEFVFIDITEQDSLTESGIGNHAGLSSMGNQPKPVEGEEDEWCARWLPAGLAKNNYTNPQDGGYSSNGGSVRANSIMEAIQIAGSHSQMYKGTKPVFAGQTLIFYPPDPNKTYEGRDERPTPVIEPLDWTRVLEGPAASTNLTMLELQGRLTSESKYMDLRDISSSSENGNSDGVADDYYSQYVSESTKMTYTKAALERKRSILTMGMAMVMILEKRNYLKILDEERSWKEATDQKMIHDIHRAQQEFDLNDPTQINEYAERIARITQDHRDNINSGPPSDIGAEDDGGRMAWVFDAEEGEQRSYDLDGLSMMKRQMTFYDEILKLNVEEAGDVLMDSDQATASLIRKMGLGENGLEDEHVQTVFEILKLACCETLDPRSTKDLLDTYEEMVGASEVPRQALHDTMRSFRDHLFNYERGTYHSYFKIKERLQRRVVAVAISSSSSTTQDTPNFAEPRIDFIIRPGGVLM